jgi:hypothetical protein
LPISCPIFFLQTENFPNILGNLAFQIFYGGKLLLTPDFFNEGNLELDSVEISFKSRDIDLKHPFISRHSGPAAHADRSETNAQLIAKNLARINPVFRQNSRADF